MKSIIDNGTTLFTSVDSGIGNRRKSEERGYGSLQDVMEKEVKNFNKWQTVLKNKAKIKKQLKEVSEQKLMQGIHKINETQIKKQKAIQSIKNKLQTINQKRACVTNRNIQFTTQSIAEENIRNTSTREQHSNILKKPKKLKTHASDEHDNSEELLQRIEDKIKRSNDIAQKSIKSRAYSTENAKITHVINNSKQNYDSLMEIRMQRLLQKYSHKLPKLPAKEQKDAFRESEEYLAKQREANNTLQKSKVKMLLSQLIKKDNKIKNNLEQIDKERKQYYQTQQQKQMKFIKRHENLAEQEANFKKSVIDKHISIGEAIDQRKNQRKQAQDMANAHSKQIRNQIEALLKST